MSLVVYANTLCNTHNHTTAAQPGLELRVYSATLGYLSAEDTILDVGCGEKALDATKFLRYSRSNNLGLKIEAIDPALESIVSHELSLRFHKKTFKEYMEKNLKAKFLEHDDYGFIQNFILNAIKINPSVIAFWGCADTAFNKSKPLSKNTKITSSGEIDGDFTAYITDIKEFLKQNWEVKELKSYGFIATPNPYERDFQSLGVPDTPKTRDLYRRGHYGD